MAENNYALKLDSVDTDRVTLATTFDIKNMSQFTFEGWIKPGANATHNNQRAFSIRQGSSKRGIRFACVPIRGKLRFELARVDGTSDTNYSYSYDWDDYWHHVAFTADFNAKEYNIYIDGGLVQTGRIVDGGSGLAVSNTTAGAVYIGAWSPSNTESDFIYWDGKIDNLRLWSTVRTQADIAASKDDHIVTSTTGLIDEWRLNDGPAGGTTTSAKIGSTGTCYRANGTINTGTLWTTDRPFLGDGVNDVDPPADNTMSAPTSITSDGFTLNWTTTTDDVYVQYYEITVATDSAFNSPVSGYSALNVGLDTSLAVTGLTPLTNYYAQVRAFDAAGNASAYATYNSNAAITTTASSDVTPPSPSTATSATNISDTGFTANWGAATDNVAVTGYKLDVSEESNFASFLGGYRNLDVGNVLTYAVTGTIDPSTTYYYRVRAYDAAQNESADSNTITVTTSAPPDTEAPSVVITQTPTSVGSTSFTARWNVGVDNVGVTGYKFDLATDEAFTAYVSGYQDLDVGNVTSYGLNFLTPLTGYYYRVRAYDAAGNISTDTEAPEAVTTRASTVEEGGTIEVAHFPIDDTYVTEVSPAGNNANSTTLQADGTPDAKRIYMHFDLREITGTIVNAGLRFNVTNASNGTYNVQLVNETIDFETITWDTDTTTYSGTPVEFIAAAEGWFEVDIASLLSGADEYTIVIHTTSTDGLTFSSLESADATLQPHLVVETDPTSSTEIDSVSVSAENRNITNLLKNPSAEVGGTAFGGSTGITAIGAATLLQDSSASYAVYADTYACKVTTTIAAGDGVKFESPTALGILGSGQIFTAILHVQPSGANYSVEAYVKLTYTDATTTTGSVQTIYLYTIYDRAFQVSAVATVGKTVDKVEVFVTDPSTTAHTFWVDAVAVIEGEETAYFFDGDSHPTDTDWDGTANASTSTYEGVVLTASATYLGDGDQDNSVVVRYKRTDATDWIETPAVEPFTDRTTKEVTASIGPFSIGNWFLNPSFANGSASPWTAQGSGVTLSVLTDQIGFDGDDTWNAQQVVTDGSTSGQGTIYIGGNLRAVQGDTRTFSVYLKGNAGGESLLLSIAGRNNAGSATATTLTQAITLTTELTRYDFAFTVVDANTYYVIPSIVVDGTAAVTFDVQAAQFEEGLIANPYIDGSRDDGMYAGLAAQSVTYRTISHEVSYDVEFEFTDPDGVIGTNPQSATVVTPAAPDDPPTTVSLTLTPSNDTIAVVAAYTGDDNESASAVVQYKRSDRATWSTVSSTFDRTNHLVLANVANLKPGTDYDVKVTFADLDDGVYGPNPLQETVTTTITGLTASAKEKISFGGFMLSGDDDSGFLVTEHDSLSHPERLTQVEQLPRADGAVELSDWWGKRVIKLKGVIVGETRDELYNRIAALRKALAPRQQRLVLDTMAANNYFFNATCTSLGIAEVGGETFRHVVYDAEFTCADPFRYEANETIESGIELFDDEEVVISNDGDLSIDPIFSISTTTSAVSLTLVNKTTGERITPDGTIGPGDSLIIDTTKLSATKNGVEIDYAGGFPRLATGQNTISVVLSSGSITLTVRRRHRYL